MAERLSKHCWATPKCGISTAERHFRFDRTDTDFRFIIVRNPFHRMVSFYNNKIIYAGVPPYELDKPYNFDAPVVIPHLEQGNTQMSFREFMRLVGNINVVHAERHLKPQYLNVENMKFDAIVRCETYPKDIVPVCEALGLNVEEYKALKVNHFKRSDINEFVADYPSKWFRKNGIPRRYDVFYDEELMDIVRRQYGKDFDLFGYDREVV